MVILGADRAGERLLRALQRERSLGLKPIAVFDNRRPPAGGALEGVPYGRTLTDAMGLARERVADTAILAMPRVRRSCLAKFVELASGNFRNVIVIPDPTGIVTPSAVMARDLAGTFGVEIKHHHLDPWALRAKRMLTY